jgi:hypothetical protein
MINKNLQDTHSKIDRISKFCKHLYLEMNLHVNSCCLCKVVLENLIVTQLVKNFPDSEELQGSHNVHKPKAGCYVVHSLTQPHVCHLLTNFTDHGPCEADSLSESKHSPHFVQSEVLSIFSQIASPLNAVSQLIPVLTFKSYC